MKFKTALFGWVALLGGVCILTCLLYRQPFHKEDFSLVPPIEVGAAGNGEPRATHQQEHSTPTRPPDLQQRQMKRGLPPLHIRNTAVERSEALLAQLRVAILGGKGDSASEILHLLWKLLGESPSLLPGLLAEYSSSGSAPFRETLIWVFSSTRDDRVMKLLGDEFLNKVNSQKLRETALELLQTQVGGLRAEAMRTHGAIESSLKKAATDVRESAAIRSTALSLIGKFSHGTDELRDLVRLVLSSEHDPSVLSSALLVATQWQESEEFMQDSLRVLHMRGAVDDDLVESAVTYLALSRLPAAGAALLKELEYNPRGAIRAAIATDLGARSEDPVVQTALLKTAKSDQNVHTRLAAIQSLSSLHDDHVLGGLRDIVIDEADNGLVRIAAAKVLLAGSIGGTVVNKKAVVKSLLALVRGDTSKVVRDGLRKLLAFEGYGSD